MQAIITKFVSPTNFRGSRISAKCAAGSLMVDWDHAMGVEENHLRAAEMLREKLGWAGELQSGGLPDGNTCHVFVKHPIVRSTLEIRLWVDKVYGNTYTSFRVTTPENTEYISGGDLRSAGNCEHEALRLMQSKGMYHDAMYPSQAFVIVHSNVPRKDMFVCD